MFCTDVMSRLLSREALWALALLSTLVPSLADGNIGKCHRIIIIKIIVAANPHHHRNKLI